MAPPLAARAETPPSLRPSSPFTASLGSAAPLVLLILLLLLCFPFTSWQRNRDRQFGTTDSCPRNRAAEPGRVSWKPEVTSEEAKTMEKTIETKLEDGSSPEETSFPGGKLHKGGPLPNCQVERQINGVAAAATQPGNSDSQNDTYAVGPNHKEKPTKSSSDPLGNLSPQAAARPNTSALGLLQLRKLPMTPKEAHILRAEPSSLSTDSQVYESIRVEDRELCARGWSEGPDLPARAMSRFAGSAGSGEGILEQPSDMCAQLAVALQQHKEPPQQLLEATPEEAAPTKPTSDVEKRLSAMYARVCKKPRAAQSLQPADCNRPASQEEEEPPPIPEKHFEDLYESISTEMQELDSHSQLPGYSDTVRSTGMGEPQTHREAAC